MMLGASECGRKGRCLELVALVLTISIFGIFVIPAFSQPEDEASVVFKVYVYSVDLSLGTAEVNITLAFDDLYGEDLQPGKPVIAMLSSEVDSVRIQCNNTSFGSFAGSSSTITWHLSGELGKGEFAPFDEYELTFRLVNVSPTSINMSGIFTDESHSFAYIEGPQRMLLSRIYQVFDNTTLLSTEFPENLKVVVGLKRQSGPFGLPFLFWTLMVPTLACYFLLGSTRFVSGKGALGNRLHVYVALFIFAPTFFGAIQDYLPLRATLSIPEVLLVNLIIVTTIFAIFNFLSVKSVLRELARDGIMLFCSFLATFSILVHLMPVFPTTALFVFQICVPAPLLLPLLVWNMRSGRELGKPPQTTAIRIIGILSLLLVNFAFLFMTYMILSFEAMVLCIGLGILGLSLMFYQVYLKKQVKSCKKCLEKQDRYWV